MAPKTLIRSKKAHEVKLSEGSQVAQSQQAVHAEGEAVVPPLIRKTPSGRRNAGAEARTTAAPTEKTPARKKALAPAPVPATPPPPRKRASGSAVTPVKAPPSPRLPARVPADGLWESDSAVMQRLQALVERNAQLSEQLQRLQNTSPSKGYKP